MTEAKKWFPRTYLLLFLFSSAVLPMACSKPHYGRRGSRIGANTLFSGEASIHLTEAVLLQALLDRLLRDHNQGYSISSSTTTKSVKGRHVIQETGYMSYHREVCDTVKTWKLLNRTYDMEGNEVEILQPLGGGPKQLVYTHECARSCSRCIGVEGSSLCKMRYSWLTMYHQRLGSSEAKWDYVQVPSHCTCELTPPGVVDLECPYR